MAKKRLVVFTGAGVSAESGISTFRDAGGLWDKYPVMQVASADGFARDPALVHQFYNMRRKELLGVEPNAAHRAIAELEATYDVDVITQNVDNLHERGGSTRVLHLHGELMKVRSLRDESRIYELTEGNLMVDENSRDEYGDGLRPHIVFFQEDVPMFERAIELVRSCDIFLIIGTSLNVYPAAGLLVYPPKIAKIIYIDTNPAKVDWRAGIKVVAGKAAEIAPTIADLLAEE
ncbi:MAG: NAD-dependent deacylase [Bacteroidales bacterium]